MSVWCSCTLTRPVNLPILSVRRTVRVLACAHYHTLCFVLRVASLPAGKVLGINTKNNAKLSCVHAHTSRSRSEGRACTRAVELVPERGSSEGRGLCRDVARHAIGAGAVATVQIFPPSLQQTCLFLAAELRVLLAPSARAGWARKLFCRSFRSLAFAESTVRSVLKVASNKQACCRTLHSFSVESLACVVMP